MALTIEAKPRSATGKKTKTLRRQGDMPAVVYGPKHQAEAISIDARAFERLFKAAGESSVISLAGLDEELEVLIHAIDADPVSGEVRHVDFYAIEKGKKVTLEVPLEFEGEAPAIKLGAVITKVLHEVEIEALARDIPQEITVDLSVLIDINDQIHVRDLVVPEGVAVLSGGDEVVAVASEVEEEPEEAPTAIDMDAIEVEQKGKDESAAEGDAPTDEARA